MMISTLLPSIPVHPRAYVFHLDKEIKPQLREHKRHFSEPHLQAQSNSSIAALRFASPDINNGLCQKGCECSICKAMLSRYLYVHPPLSVCNANPSSETKMKTHA